MLSIAYIKHFAAIHADIAYALVALGVILEGEIVVDTVESAETILKQLATHIPQNA